MAFGPSCSRMLNFYPRPPRGGRQLKVKNFNIFLKISIHALREEGDYNDCEIPLLKKVFLSTPSARRATVPNNRLIDNQFAFLSTPSARRATRRRIECRRKFGISIHALREEGDAV